MPEYLSPGVYIEEVPSGPVPIEGVSTSTAGFVGQAERGPLKPRLVTSFSDYQRLYGAPTDPAISYLGFAVEGFFANGGTRAFIAHVAGQDAKAAASDDVVPGYRIEAIGPGAWGDGLYLGVEPASGARSKGDMTTFKLTAVWYAETPKTFDRTDSKAYRPPDAEEIYDNLSFDPAAPNAFLNAINGVSTLVRASLIDAKTTAAPMARPLDGSLKLEGGKDGRAIGAEDYKGSTEKDGEPIAPEARTGLASLAPIGEVSILVVPDHHRVGVTEAVVAQCEELTDRFAVLHFSPEQNEDLANQSVPMDSSYAAIYAPWLRVPDPADPKGLSSLVVPPSGHIAGIYARTDLERGVHKAPANEEVKGIVMRDRGNETPLVPSIDQGLQDVLNPRNINCIRDLRSEGRGIRVWGARTMSSNDQWRYVPVRRLLIFVEQSVELATQWVVFEPNSEYTWIRVVASVSNFLGTVWRNGALFGATPQEAYFVKCDMTTMTPDDIDNGRLICLVGIAPLKPAEFVIFRFTQKTIEAQS